MDNVLKEILFKIKFYLEQGENKKALDLVHRILEILHKNK